jgi:hypothetical protein
MGRCFSCLDTSVVEEHERTENANCRMRESRKEISTDRVIAPERAASLLLSIPLLGGGSHQVQSGTGLEEFNLASVERVVDLDLVFGTILVGDLNIERLSRGEVLEAEDRDLVRARDLVVIGRVLESQSQHT